MSATGRRTAVDVTDGDGAVGYNGVRDGSDHRPGSGVHSRKMAWFRAAANVTQAMYENKSIPAVRPTHPDATQGRRDGCPEQDDLAGRWLWPPLGEEDPGPGEVRGHLQG
jgi:hypothetical protein